MLKVLHGKNCKLDATHSKMAPPPGSTVETETEVPFQPEMVAGPRECSSVA